MSNLKVKKPAGSEPAVVCVCGAVRGKYAKPWHVCSDCGKPVCLSCWRSWREPPVRCLKCENVECEKRHKLYEEELARQMLEPATCPVCEQVKTFGDMRDSPYEPFTCEQCVRVYTAYGRLKEEYDRKRHARPGLVECSLSEVDPPTKDGGYGYAYRDPGFDLKLGDTVLLPATMLQLDGGTNVGTVISTYSNYAGAVHTVLAVIRRAGESS